MYPSLNEPVVIDRSNKLILVHLSKTGGTSVAAAITKKTRGEGKKHWTLKDYREKLPDFSEYHSFGTLGLAWQCGTAVIYKIVSQLLSHSINGSANREDSANREGL